MTTKVLVVCPDNSAHDALVYVERLQEDGTWERDDDPHSVAPTEQAPPIYIDAKTRIVVEEEGREHVDPR